MEIPGLGTVTKDDSLDWYWSEPLPIPVLRGQTCRVIVESYDGDKRPEHFHEAIKNFLAVDFSVLQEVEDDLFAYYQDCKNRRNEMTHEDDSEAFPVIESSSDVWSSVRLGDEPVVSRRPRGEKGVYVSLECGCQWEREHGLQIVFQNGLKVNKIGPFDGHLTNADSYSKKFADFLYVSFS